MFSLCVEHNEKDYHPKYHKMQNLPWEMHAEIAKRLDPKSRARLRTVSKEMKEAVDASQPPTGSYQHRTGRFQGRFANKGMYKCMRRVRNALDGAGMTDADFSALEFFSIGRLMWHDMKKSYRKNTILHDFRQKMQPKTIDDLLKEVREIFPGIEVTRELKKDLMTDLRNEQRQQREYRRRVVRLLKAWSETDHRYTETLHLVRSWKHVYTDLEESMHRDRLMDAIIVQSLVISHSDDPTKRMVNQSGRELTMDQKINRLVKNCSSRHVS